MITKKVYFYALKYLKMKKLYSPFALRTAFVVLLMLSFVRGWGQSPVSITASPQTYTQDFNTLSTTGTAFTNGTTLQGWYISSSTLLVGDGGGNSNSCYNYGPASNTDRSIGALSNATTHRFGARFRNNTGSAITSVTISYTGEQWRQTNQTQSLVFDYRISNTPYSNYLTDGAALFVANTELDFTVLKTGAAGAIDGNATSNRTAKSATLSVNIPAGSELFIRWTKSGSTSPGLSVDDLTVNFGPAAPTLTVSTSPTTNPVQVAGLDYIFGAGPSTAKTFTASGSNLSADVIITPSANYEVSNGGTTWFNSTSSPALSLSFGTGTLNNTSISVRLKAGLAVGNYNTTSDKITLTSTGATSKEIALSGEVTAPPSPTISFGTFTTTAMTYPVGTGPSASQNASVSGSNLTNDITITSSNTSQWEVSKTGVDGSWGNSVTYTRTGTSIGTGNNIYVRLKSGLAVSPYSGMLTASSTGAVDKTYTLSGEVFQPAVTVSNNTFTQFTYAEGQGPSANQSFVVSGSNLASDITINVPSARWELSTTATFDVPLSSLVLPKNASNGVANTTIYVRLKAGISQGSYVDNNGLEVLSASTITQTKNLDGLVTEPKAELEVRGVFTTLDESNVIPNGDTTPMFLDNTEFAAQNIGNSQTKTFRLRNVGGLLLSVSSITVSNTTDFSVTSSAPYNIAGASYADFTITFQPQSMGIKTGIVTIANTDLTDNPYTFTVQGVGENAEIEVTGNNVVIPNGNTAISATDHTLIGSANASTTNPTTISKTFVIRNTGNIALAVSGITITGANANQFSVSPTTTSIAANTTGIITVTFAPTSSGVKNAVISIANNDATDGENPYAFAVQGNSVDFIVCAAGETLIYQTGFEVSEDFEQNGGTYSNTTVFFSGPTTQQWGTYFGTPSGTSPLIGSQSLQMRWYTATPNSRGYSYTNFNLSNLKRVVFNAANTNGINVIVSYSTDSGNTWIGGQTFILSTANTEYEYLLPSSIPSARIRFDLTYTTAPTGTSRLYIDNVRIYGGSDNSKTWNGTAWSGDGLPPTSSQKAIIDGDLTLPYTTAGNTYTALEACECQVNVGKILKIGTSDVLAHAIIQGKIVNNGRIIVDNDSNLKQLDPLADNSFPSNSFEVKRIANIKRQDYVYWSSPVAGQNLKAFSPGTLNVRFLSYDELTNAFVPVFTATDSSTATTVFGLGAGYAIRASNSQPNTVQDWLGQFVGTPNNGNVDVDITKNGEGNNLIGNPYPSNINLSGSNGLFTLNSGKTTDTAYFWTNVNPNVPATQNYNQANYAVYTQSGSNPAQNSTVEPTGVVKVGQAFIVQALSTGTLNIRNEMREASAASIFFDKNASDTKDRFWLRLTTPANDFNTTLIAYIQNATNGFEYGFDANVFGQSSDAVYTKLDSQKFAIQGRQFPLNTKDVVSVGSSHFASGQYKFSISKAEGIFTNGQHVYLKDKHANTITDLSAGDYVFNAVAGNTEGRFEIVYENDLVLGTDNQVRKNLIIYRNGDEFIIKSNDDKITEVELYDSVGRLLITVKPNATEARINVSYLSNAFYVLKINQNGKVSSKKVIK